MRVVVRGAACAEAVVWVVVVVVLVVVRDVARVVHGVVIDVRHLEALRLVADLRVGARRRAVLAA